MRERIYVYDRAGNPVNDPERSVDYATGLTIETIWPGGYGSASFTVPRNIAIEWVVKDAYTVQVLDGLTEIYYGRLDDLQKSLSGQGQLCNNTARGFWVLLNERRIRKWWVDNKPISRTYVLDGWKDDADQLEMDADWGEDFISMRGGYGDQTHSNGDMYRRRYTLPSGTYISYVTCDYCGRTGERIDIRYYSVTADSVLEEVHFSGGTNETGSMTEATWTTDTTSMDFQFFIYNTDIYDQNDRAEMYDITIKAKYETDHPDYAAPAWTVGEMVIDALLLAELDDTISSDWSRVIDPAYAPAGFATAGGGFEEVGKTINRLLLYGDSSYNTYGAAIWGIDGTPDRKARFEVSKRDTSNYQWYVTLNDLTDFQDSLDLSGVANWVIVRYTDKNDQEQYRSPVDTSVLEDTTSQKAYGRRDSQVQDIGQGTSTDADRYGARYLTLHKDPLHKGQMTLTGRIRNAQQAEQWVNRVRAGQTVYLADYSGGLYYFIRRTQYNAETGELTIEPDSGPDSIAVLEAQKASGW